MRTERTKQFQEGLNPSAIIDMKKQKMQKRTRRNEH